VLRIDLAVPDCDLEPLIEALLAGKSVVIPTDTVYGLACAAHLPDACERTLRLKGRDLSQPSAVMAASLETVFSTVLPELLGRAGARARLVLPGLVTVIVPNPSRRFRWLCGSDSSSIGLRVPDLAPALAAAVDRVGAVMATSANLHGGPDPASLDDVPAEILDRVAVVVDGGRLPAGRASTIIDLRPAAPTVLRDGAVPAERVLAALGA